ncbi:hypothetical protein SASPL_152382 [Salvia splendens]|uniref:Retrotransposon gag domain-containing protein n=1 Tax=Salvia splendens TaxID=180675 RepID=A0A8X8W3S2_SALSN|nr:hypothetical protein SASPL_152382 [Salvia splendens]
MAPLPGKHGEADVVITHHRAALEAAAATEQKRQPPQPEQTEAEMAVVVDDSGISALHAHDEKEPTHAIAATHGMRTIAIKSGVLAVLTHFYGLSKECPYSFLEEFCRYCNIQPIPAGSTSEDYRLKAIPFILKGDTGVWLSRLPEGSIRTWAEFRMIFLDLFFLTSKTSALKREITEARQEYDEPLGHYWDRFQGLLQACPNHKLGEREIYSIFYGGLMADSKNDLNLAAQGDFSKTPFSQAKNILERLIEAKRSYETTRGQDKGTVLKKKNQRKKKLGQRRRKIKWRKVVLMKMNPNQYINPATKEREVINLSTKKGEPIDKQKELSLQAGQDERTLRRTARRSILMYTQIEDSEPEEEQHSRYHSERRWKGKQVAKTITEKPRASSPAAKIGEPIGLSFTDKEGGTIRIGRRSRADTCTEAAEQGSPEATSETDRDSSAEVHWQTEGKVPKEAATLEWKENMAALMDEIIAIKSTMTERLVAMESNVTDALGAIKGDIANEMAALRGNIQEIQTCIASLYSAINKTSGATTRGTQSVFPSSEAHPSNSMQHFPTKTAQTAISDDPPLPLSKRPRALPRKPGH